VGVAAATGSYESHTSWVPFYASLKRHCLSPAYIGDAATEYYFGFVLNGLRHLRPGQGKRVALARMRLQFVDAFKSPARRWFLQSRFPPFPNPHIRSNAFFMKRERFLATSIGPLRSKWHAWAYESGRIGLTAQLRRQGLEAVLVTRQGEGFGVADWCQSGTYRMGTQPNLLISDNQTRIFLDLAPGHQVTSARMAWGDYLGPAPADYPNIFAFARDPRAIPQPSPSELRGKSVLDRRVA
jgi:hypothetical protein